MTASASQHGTHVLAPPCLLQTAVSMQQQREAHWQRCGVENGGDKLSGSHRDNSSTTTAAAAAATKVYRVSRRRSVTTTTTSSTATAAAAAVEADGAAELQGQLSPGSQFPASQGTAVENKEKVVSKPIKIKNPPKPPQNPPPPNKKNELNFEPSVCTISSTWRKA